MLKLNMVNDIEWSHHRSGWGYVLELLKPLQDNSGILFDGSIDTTFGHSFRKVAKVKSLPYKKDWVGFIHNPINICPWYKGNFISPHYILNSKHFQESLHCCRGIFTLSNHLANYIRSECKNAIRVDCIFHPTEASVLNWDYDEFLQNKRLFQLGHWMRKLTTFFKLKAEGYQKYYPLPKGDYTLKLLSAEMNYCKNISREELMSVRIMDHLDNGEYDTLLSNSVVFLDLYDSSVNNVIIECINRNTPVIVNKIAPVVEYLGADYPLYYNTIEEAEAIISDTNLIFQGYIYLKYALDKAKLTSSNFVNAFINSPVFYE